MAEATATKQQATEPRTASSPPSTEGPSYDLTYLFDARFPKRLEKIFGQPIYVVKGAMSMAKLDKQKTVKLQDIRDAIDKFLKQPDLGHTAG